jgi:hypothetical protein
MDITWLYVSRSMLRLPQEAGEVERIVSWSESRNRELHVTGALVFTETQFAQYLEGPEQAMLPLMESISRDSRHADLRTILRRPLDHGRRFPTWALAYAGPSTFVAGHVLSVSDAGATPADLKWADRLVGLMRQFVDAQLKEQERKRTG